MFTAEYSLWHYALNVVIYYMIFKNRDAQIPGDSFFFYGGAKYLWVLSMEPASSKPVFLNLCETAAR
jgi:hypothetical protein